MSTVSPIKPDLFAFLDDVAHNNDRDWFAANKDRYETEVRQPVLELIQRQDALQNERRNFATASGRR